MNHIMGLQKHLEYLHDVTVRVLKSCEKSCVNNFGTDIVKKVLHVPSGDMKYPSFWTRDAAMMAESGLIGKDELKDWLELISEFGQNGVRTLYLKHDLKVPPWSIADHINFDFRPVFYPGTYESGNDQGDGHFGYYPPHDNQYYFISIAYSYFKCSGDIAAFRCRSGDMNLLQRLEKAFQSYGIDHETQLCQSFSNEYTVDWGFCDQIKKSGLLLFPSLLRYRAALELSEMLSAAGLGERANGYSQLGQHLKHSIIHSFYDPSGWFLSSTKIGKQKDVWGTAFAVWLELCDGEHRRKSLEALANAFKQRTAVDNGYVRHILTSEDKTRYTAWESTFCPLNTYQNGGYWAAPTGWYLYSLMLYDMNLAEKMLEDFVVHTRNNETNGAPFEWRSKDDSKYEGVLYGASAALPYAAAKRIWEEVGQELNMTE